MTPFESLTFVLFAAVVVLAATTLLVSGRKLLRDRRERRSRRRVAGMRAALAHGTARDVRTSLKRITSDRAELDFVRVMDALLPTLPAHRLQLLQQVAVAAGFVRRHRRRYGDRHPAERGRAALVLTRLRLSDTVEDLRPLLHDPDADVRLTACAGIAIVEDPRGVAVLLDAIADGWLQPERVIERIGKPWAVGALLEALQDRTRDPDRDSRTIVAITRALGAAGDRRAEPALLGVLAEGTEEERISAARALGEIGADHAVTPLIAALNDPSWPLRAQAAKSLGALAAPAAVPALERSLADRGWWIRANAANALRALGPAGIEALRRAAGSDDRYARDRAREALSLASVRETRGAEPAVGVLAVGDSATPEPSKIQVVR